MTEFEVMSSDEILACLIEKGHKSYEEMRKEGQSDSCLYRWQQYLELLTVARDYLDQSMGEYEKIEKPICNPKKNVLPLIVLHDKKDWD